jgi:MFS family permease
MATTETTAAAPATRADPRRWWALVTVSLGLFMALLDVTIVNVALPTIGDDLNTSFADLQWVVSAYTLALAVSSSPPDGLATSLGASASLSWDWAPLRSARCSARSPATSRSSV